MTVKSDDSTVIEPIANGGVTPEMQQMIQKIVMGIFKDAMPRMIEQTMTKSVPGLLDKIAEEALKEEPTTEATAVGNTAGAQDRLNLKTLQQQVESERKARLDLEKKLNEERQAGINTKMKSDVLAQFAKHAGADNPHLRPYVNEYLSQFVHKDGGFFRKVTGEYGEESHEPLDQAVEKLFKNELKHLLPARNGNLPPARVTGAQGSPFLTQRPQTPAGVNPMALELAEGLTMAGRPELAQQVLDSAARNGTPQK